MLKKKKFNYKIVQNLKGHLASSYLIQVSERSTSPKKVNDLEFIMDYQVMILTPILDLGIHNLHKYCFPTEIRVYQASAVVLDMRNKNEYTSYQ